MTFEDKLAQFDADHAAKVERRRQQRREFNARWSQGEASRETWRRKNERARLFVRHFPFEQPERRAACP